MCHIQLQVLSVSELWSFDCVFMLILYNLHSCTLHNSLTIKSGQCVEHKNECSYFLKLKVMPPLSWKKAYIGLLAELLFGFGLASFFVFEEMYQFLFKFYRRLKHC